MNTSMAIKLRFEDATPDQSEAVRLAVADVDAGHAALMASVCAAFAAGVERVTFLDDDDRELGWIDADGRSHVCWPG